MLLNKRKIGRITTEDDFLRKIYAMGSTKNGVKYAAYFSVQFRSFSVEEQSTLSAILKNLELAKYIQLDARDKMSHRFILNDLKIPYNFEKLVRNQSGDLVEAGFGVSAPNKSAPNVQSTKHSIPSFSLPPGKNTHHLNHQTYFKNNNLNHQSENSLSQRSSRAMMLALGLSMVD